MPIDPQSYVPPYVSEINREVDGDLDDCVLGAVISLGALWTGGEILYKPDGTRRSVIDMREQRVKVLGEGKRSGGLTLPDADKFIRSFDPRLPKLPYYPMQKPYDGTLRVTFEEFWSRISNGEAGILLGNPSLVKDASSPLRTKQGNDDYGHAIMVYRGQLRRARVYDSLTRQGPSWTGEWVPKEDLQQFSRAYGDPTAIGCALIEIGSETMAAREQRKAIVAVNALNTKLSALRRQYDTLESERSKTVEELVQANLRISTLAADLESAESRIEILESGQNLDEVRKAARQSFKDDVLAIPA